MPSKRKLKRQSRADRYEEEKLQESADAKQARLQNLNDQRKLSRSEETFDQRESRLLINKSREKSRLAKESSDETAIRLQSRLQFAHAKLQAETSDQSENRRSKSLARVTARNQSESGEQRSHRLANARRRTSSTYESLSEADKNRLLNQISSNAIILKNKCNQHNKSTSLPSSFHTTVQHDGNTSDIGQPPTSTESQELHQASNNSTSSPNNDGSSLPPFTMSGHIEAFLSEMESIEFNECFNCSNRWPNLKLNKDTNMCEKCTKHPTKYTSVNNMDPEPIPYWFLPYTDLTQIEQMLISQVLPLMTLYRLPFGQYGYKGHIINFAQDVQNFATKLPRRLTANDILIVRKAGSAGTHKDFRVRRSKVVGALKVLKRYNHYYKDIEIDDISAAELPEDGEYVTSNCTIEVDDDDDTTMTSSTSDSLPITSEQTTNTSATRDTISDTQNSSSPSDDATSQTTSEIPNSQSSSIDERDILIQRLHFLRNYGRYESQNTRKTDRFYARQCLEEDWSRYLCRVVIPRLTNSQIQKHSSQTTSRNGCTSEPVTHSQNDIPDSECSPTVSQLMADFYSTSAATTSADKSDATTSGVEKTDTADDHHSVTSLEADVLLTLRKIIDDIDSNDGITSQKSGVDEIRKLCDSQVQSSLDSDISLTVDQLMHNLYSNYKCGLQKSATGDVEETNTVEEHNSVSSLETDVLLTLHKLIDGIDSNDRITSQQSEADKQRNSHDSQAPSSQDSELSVTVDQLMHDLYSDYNGPLKSAPSMSSTTNRKTGFEAEGLHEKAAGLHYVNSGSHTASPTRTLPDNSQTTCTERADVSAFDNSSTANIGSQTSSTYMENLDHSYIPNSQPTSEASVNNPLDETCFVPAALNRRSEQNNVADRFAEVSGHKDPDSTWPPLHSDPVNEFNVEGYVVRAFPTLFPTGKADFNAIHKYKPTAAEYYQHLMRYKDGRFARHPRFRYFGMNTIYRWRALSCGNVYVKQNPGDSRLTADDIKQLNDAEKKSLMKKMVHFGSNIRGTPQYWRSRRNELVHFIDQFGMPTLFFTLSSADFHWPNLHRLLPNYTNKATALADNPAIVDWFCHNRMHAFVKFILMRHFPGAEFWFRDEWQTRGSLHIHGVIKMKKAPDVNLLKTRIDLDAEAVLFYDEYCHAWNPASDANGNINMVPQSANPSSITLSDVTNVDDDYKNLANTCQRHTRCMENYCLRRKPGSSVTECRFGFPKELRQHSTITREINEETAETTVKIELKRNDPLLNVHNRTCLQVHRANIDFQPIEDKSKLIGYILKYATKAETRSTNLNELFKTLINQMGPTDGVRILAQKVLTKTVGERDFSSQEVCHHLNQDSLVSCSRSFVHVNVSGSRELFNDCDAITMPNALDKYFSRPKEARYDISLFDFMKQYFVTKGEIRRHFKQPVVVPHPWTPSHEDHPQHEQFCRNHLLFYKPMWSIDELSAGFSDCKSAYRAFIQSHGRRRNFANDMEEAEENQPNGEEEQNDLAGGANEQDDPLRHTTEDWMLLCQHQAEFPSVPPDAHDWLQNDREYNVPEMKTFVERSKLRATTTNDEHDSAEPPIDFSTLNKSQMRAFKMVETYFNRNNLFEEPLRLIVSGTAGTGKSYLIKCIKQLMGKHCKVVAPTGVAAHNINGQTLHRCFRLGIAINDNTPDLSGDALMEAQVDNSVVDLFVIDEMSMVGKKLFGIIDRRMRQLFTETASAPLGGKAVVLVGDFGQLNPVCDAPLYSTHGISKLADVGSTMYSEFKHAVVLEAAIRQSKDPRFLATLTRIRNDQATLADYLLLATRFEGFISTADRSRFDDAIRIFPRVQQVLDYNLDKLKTLAKKYPTARIDAVHSGGKKAESAAADEAGGLPRTVFMCKTARVMLTTNLWVEKGLCNGSMGTVIDIVYSDTGPPTLPEFVVVQFDNFSGTSCLPDIPNCVPIVPIRRYWSSGSTTCSRQQIPLTLSWAITVHKSQGLTLPFAVVDLSTFEFCPQLTFVALSRVPTLTNLMLIPFDFDRIKNLCGKGTRFMERYAEDVRLKELDIVHKRSRDTSVLPMCAVATPTVPQAHINLQASPPTPPQHHPAPVFSEYLSLTNPNNCCYSNSVVQCLILLPSLLPTLQAINPPVEFELGNFIERSLRIFGPIPQPAQSYSTKQLRQTLDAAVNRPNHYSDDDEQRDAADFMSELITSLSNEMARHFMLQKSQKSICQACGTTSVSDVNDCIGVDHVFISQDHSGECVTINSLLAAVSNDRNQCVHCQCSTRHEISNSYTIPSETTSLVVELPIFYNIDLRANYRLMPFECENISFGGAQWTLVGVVLHSGPTLRSGHYKARIKQQGYWLLISDKELQARSTLLPPLDGCQLMFYKRD